MGHLSGLIKDSIYKQIHRFRIRSLRSIDPRRTIAEDPFQHVWIDAGAVQLYLPRWSVGKADVDTWVVLNGVGRFHTTFSAGLISGGNWSEKALPYGPTPSLLYDAIKRSVEMGAPIEKSSWVEYCIRQVKSGQAVWNGARTEKAVAERCVRANVLLESVLTDGFRDVGRPVCVCVGPQGEFIKSGNGQHRIMIGRALGVSIPVRILAVHRTWAEGYGYSLWPS